MDQLSLSFATYYNEYTDLRSFNSEHATITTATGPKDTTLLTIANGQKAKAWGFEVSANYQPTSWWRMRTGYTFLKKQTSPTNSNVLPISDNIEGVDPEHQVMLQSIMDLPKNIQLDMVGLLLCRCLKSFGTYTFHAGVLYLRDVRLAAKNSITWNCLLWAKTYYRRSI